MTKTVTAMFDGQTFQFETPLDLEANAFYTITISPVTRIEPDPNDGDAWDVLESLIGSVKAPPDWSDEHDHYIHGAPKRSSENKP